MILEEDRRRERLRLYHVHLPKLAEAGLIEWDRDEDEVRPGRRFDEASRLHDLVREFGRPEAGPSTGPSAADRLSARTADGGTMPSNQSLSEAVVTAVADRDGVDPTELDRPLYEVVDVDALDRLFRDGQGAVSFEYAGYLVTVDHEGNAELGDCATAGAPPRPWSHESRIDRLR